MSKNKIASGIGLFLTVLYLFSLLLYFVFDKIVSVAIPVNIKETIIFCTIIVVIGLFCWFIVIKLMKIITNAGDESCEAGLSKAIKEEKKVVCCDNDNSVLCSLMVGVNMYNTPITEKDRLYSKSYVYTIEGIGRDKPWSDIWVFSADLSTEIDSKTNGAEKVVKKNIVKNRTRYTFFYLNSNDNEGIRTINYNMDRLNDSFSKRERKLLSFVPIDVSYGYIGNHTLPLLCGSILFGIKDKRTNIPDFTEGYLSIRKDENDIPIYYKMPSCMLREYTEYYKGIINSKNGGES